MVHEDVALPFLLNPQLANRVARLAESQRPALLRCVSRAFPDACASLVEDAVSAAVFEAVLRVHEPRSAFARALATRREADFFAVLRRVAWRQLRGYLRRKANRVEARVDVEPLYDSDPELALSQKELFLRLMSTMDTAARLHAKRDPARLKAALCDRFESGDSDPAVALRHGVRREQITNARNWTRRAMGA